MQKVAIVTGASRGIGAATAKLLSARGYAVAVHYHTQREKALNVVDAIVKAGGKAIAVPADMGIEPEILQLFEVVDKQLGQMSALVNNAGFNPNLTGGLVEEMSYETLNAVFRTNVFGVFIACREAAKRMQKTGGAIVNLSSEAARFGGNNITAYASSKAAVNTFTIGYAREVAKYNIRVNAVSPGIVDTDMHKDITPQRLESLKASMPLGRMGKAEEAAETIAWLLSDAASYISGAIIPVAGGR